MSAISEKPRPARAEIPVEDFRVKIEPMGSRPFGFTAYNVTVSTPQWTRYEQECSYNVWAKGLSDKRIMARIRLQQRRLARRLAKPMFDGRLGDFTGRHA